MNKLEKNYFLMTQCISSLQTKATSLAKENHGLRYQIDNFTQLLKNSQAEVKRIEKLASLDVETIAKTDNSNDLSFVTEVKGLDLLGLDNTLDY